MIEKLSRSLGILKPKDRTFLEIEPTGEANAKLLRLKSGRWNSKKEPWLVVDEKQKAYAMMPIDTLSKIVENFKRLEEEAFALKLEKSILQHIPLDFNDVWAVAVKEIEKQKKTPKDFDKVILKIKKEYPNLFLDLHDFHFPEGMSVISTGNNEGFL